MVLLFKFMSAILVSSSVTVSLISVKRLPRPISFFLGLTAFFGVIIALPEVWDAVDKVVGRARTLVDLSGLQKVSTDRVCKSIPMDADGGVKVAVLLPVEVAPEKGSVKYRIFVEGLPAQVRAPEDKSRFVSEVFACKSGMQDVLRYTVRAGTAPIQGYFSAVVTLPDWGNKKLRFSVGIDGVEYVGVIKESGDHKVVELAPTA